ncbi:glycosyltransferase [Lactiplantibacillus plajomi]|uniref:Glycosyltransferase n=2 Tax=Lactiplantibacillus plajomi TaxID=1457217 RepID=A0ABV6K2T2_9LACO
MQINSGQRYAGVSAMIYHLYQNMDHERIQFDFVAPKTSSFSIYRKQIEDAGGRIIELKTSGNFIKRKIQFFKRLSHLIKENQYEIVHVNSGSIFLNIQVSWIAKFCGVKTIIAHSHTGGNIHPFLTLLTKLTKPLLEFGPNLYFACSNSAARFMFLPSRIKRHDYTVIDNGIKIEQFKFNSKVRTDYRSKLGLNGKTVFLHVGRFQSVKNHHKLVQVFADFHKAHPNSVLLLAGEGELLDSVKNQVKQLGLSVDVRFLGLRKDVASLMSAADIFVLPSLFEGLPVVGVEAQAAGLPILFSSSITDEVNLIPESNFFMDLKASDADWAQAAQQLVDKNKQADRTIAAKKVARAGYSLPVVAKQVEQIYLQRASGEVK